jgi:O-antigen/teichoic acid export membrane protein
MSLRRNFTSILSWTIASQVVAVCTIPVLSRLFPPEAYGVLALYTSICAIADALFSLRLEWYIPNSRTTQMVGVLATGALATCVVFTVLFGLAAHFTDAFNAWLPAAAGVHYGAAFIVLIALSILFQAAENVAMSLRVLDGVVRRVGSSKFLRQVAAAGFAVGAYFAYPDYRGLILATTASAAVPALYLGWGSGLLDAIRSVGGRFGRLSRTAAAIWRRTLVSSAVSVNNAFSYELVPIILIALYSPEVAGLYFMSRRLLAKPVSLISSSMSSSFWAYAAAQVRSEPARLKRRYLSLTGKLALLSIPFAVAVYLASFLMPVVLGQKWAETASVLPATLPLAIGSLVFSGLGHLIVLKKHHYQLVADTTRLGLMLASTWLAWRLGASGTTAILMMSSSSLAGHLIFFLAHLYAYHKLGIKR